MAAGEIAGKGGSLTCDNLTVGVKSWTLNLVGDVHEITDYDDAGVKKYLAGCDGWSGTCEVNWDATNKTLDVGDTITDIVFTISASCYYTGDFAFVTAITVTSAVADIVSMSVSFQGSEDMVLTAS